MKKIFVLLFLALLVSQANAQYALVKIGGNYMQADVQADKSAAIDLGIGFQARSYLYVGMITGVHGLMNGSRDRDGVYALPFLANAVLSLPNSSRFTPLIDLAFGYEFAVAHAEFSKPEYENAPGFVRMHAMPGINVRLTDRFSLEAAGGWTKLNDSYGDYGYNTKNVGGKLSLVITLY